MKKFIVIFVLFIIILISGCKETKTNKFPKIENLPTSLSIERGQNIDLYNLGITAYDDIDGDITDSISFNNIDVTALPAGTHYIQVQAKNSNNYATYEKIKLIVVDTISPVFIDLPTEIIIPKSTYCNLLKFGINAVDKDYNGNNYEPVAYDFNFKNTSILEIGEYELYVAAIDLSGNAKVENIKLVIKDPKDMETNADAFDFDKDTGGIWGYNSAYGSNVVIPEKIDGVIVKEIRHNAFDNKNIDSVYLPNTIEFIYLNAFARNNLEGIIIPNSVKEIQTKAFIDNDFKYVEIPDSISKLGSRVFANNSIAEVEVNGDIKNLRDYWTYVDLPIAVMPNIKYSNGFYYVPKLETIYDYDGNKKNIEIPSEIEGTIISNISMYAFSNKNLQSVIFPNTIKNIGKYAFENNDLENILIPEGMLYLDDYVFTGNNEIESVEIESTLETIGDYCFSSNNITEVIIHGDENRFNSDWTMIGFPVELMPGVEFNNGYYYYSELGTIFAYDNSYGLEIEIPSEINGTIITNIAPYAFANKNLKSVILPNTLQTIEKFGFYNNDLEEVIIPEGVFVLEEQVFQSNDIISITIGSTVESIGRDCFFPAYITEVIIYGEQTRFNNDWEEIGLPLILKQ